MRSGSVRKRIILLFTCSILVFCTLTAVFLTVLEERVMVEAVKENIVSLTEDAGAHIYIGDGPVQVDEHIRYYLDGTYIVICDERGKVLHGQLPDGFTNEARFEAGRIRTILSGGGEYFVYDEMVPGEDAARAQVWVRGIAPASLREISPSLYIMSRLFLAGVPALILLAALAGWYITRRAFAPLGRIVNTASSIHEGTDLSRRIGMGSPDSEDEILRTAGVFDSMLERVQDSFNRERQFTNNVSHELRTPVAVIMSQSEYALEHREDPQITAQALENILNQSRKMRELISRLLFLARADGGRQKIHKEKVDIGLCAEVSAAMLSESAAAEGISVSVESEEGIYVMGDETMLEQMFTNLISNGIKYGKPGGWVKVRIRSDRRLVTVLIDDNGRGIRSSELERIWERFYRAEDTGRRDRYDSSGLGLPISKWIVEAHGGSISVVSTPGEGTCFKITLAAWSGEAPRK